MPRSDHDQGGLRVEFSVLSSVPGRLAELSERQRVCDMALASLTEILKGTGARLEHAEWTAHEGKSLQGVLLIRTPAFREQRIRAAEQALEQALQRKLKWEEFAVTVQIDAVAADATEASKTTNSRAPAAQVQNIDEIARAASKRLAATPRSTPAPAGHRASGVPNANERARSARIFISSTFRDMRRERDVLATKTFRTLERTARARGVEMQEVDLRWGVNEEDPTLDICLAAVRRSNWFVGLLGQRYGTLFEDEHEADRLSSDYPCAREGLGRSLTEIEILEGVLSNKGDGKTVLFFERDPAWLQTLSPNDRRECEDTDAFSRAKLADLKARIRVSGASVFSFSSPEDLDHVFSKQVSEALQKAFPVEGGDDPWSREHALHSAYARERLGLHIGGDVLLGALDEWMQDQTAPKATLITGESGGGKSTLVAQWTARWSRENPKDVVFAHYLGASPTSASPTSMLTRLWLHLNRVTGVYRSVPPALEQSEDICDELNGRLEEVSALALREDCNVVLALDGLDKLPEAYRELRWLPRKLPSRVRLIASTLDRTRDAALALGWRELRIPPLDPAQQGQLIADTLRSWNKSDFPAARKQKLLGHSLASLPLFLKTILEELRVSATNDVLDGRLEACLQATDMPVLFESILAQVEVECGERFVATAVSVIWASRAGLEEDRIVALSGATKLAWERLRNRLGDGLRDIGGRIAFSHDYLRQAIERRHLRTEEAKRKTHVLVADHFDDLEPSDRQIEELLYQLREAELWDRLEATLTNLDHFALLNNQGESALLSLWLPLKARGWDIEKSMCAAFHRRSVHSGSWTDSEIDLALAVTDFLSLAGAYGPTRTKLQEDIVSQCTRRFGPDHGRTAQASTSLAFLLQELNRGDEALSLLERALTTYETIYGAEDPIVATAAGNLGRLLKQLGRSAEAEPLVRRAVDLEANALGATHLDTVHALNTLADLLRDQHRYEEAEPYARRVLAICERHHDAYHPDVATALGNLATLLSSTNRLAEALPLIERALSIRERTFGPEHPYTAGDLRALASMLRQTRREGEAEALYRRALNIYEGAFGPRHPDVGRTLNALASLLVDVQRHTEAEPYARRALLLNDQGSGSSYPGVVESLDILARLLVATNRAAEAAPLMQRASTIKREHGDGHADDFDSQIALLLADGRNAEAESLAKQALKSAQKDLGSHHPSVALKLLALASILRSAKRPAIALPLVRRALKIDKMHLGDKHTDTGACLNTLGMVLHEMRRYREAESCFREAVAIFEGNEGHEHQVVATTLYNLASSLDKRRRDHEAAATLRRVLANDERNLGMNHLQVAGSLNHLAVVLENMKMHGDAVPLYERAITIYEANGDPYATKVRRNLEACRTRIARQKKR